MGFRLGEGKEKKRKEIFLSWEAKKKGWMEFWA